MRYKNVYLIHILHYSIDVILFLVYHLRENSKNKYLQITIRNKLSQR